MSRSALIGRLRLKHLELFRHVTEQQTLRGAAELAHMTQPGASKLIQELEEMLGARLFTRGRQGVRLTREGEALSRHVDVLLADLDHMAQEVRLLHAGSQGHLRLGVLPSLAPGLLAQAMAQLYATRPGITCSVQEGSTTELLEALERNTLDLAFARVLDRAQVARLQLTAVYTEPFGIVVGREHPLTQVPPKQRWRALAQARWVLPQAGTPLRATIEQLLARHKQLRPTASVECHALDKVAELVASAGLVGVLPRSVATHGVQAGDLHWLVGDIFLGVTSLVSRSHVEVDPVAREFIRCVRRAALDLGLR